MAAPSYLEDLTDINLAEATTNWSAYGGGGAGLSASPDLSMQGTNCVDKQVTNADKGAYFDNGSGITLGTNEHVFVWLFCGTPGLTDTIQNKGVSVLLGNTGSRYTAYHVAGNDTYGAAGRVGVCYPIDYAGYWKRYTNSVSPYRTQVGTPTSTAAPQVFGGGLVTTASVKGANVGIDAIRRGTGAYLTAGELISAGDASDNPCTFAGFQAQNDAIANRWGLLTLVGGTYELQGRFVIGQNTSKVATLCRFEDSNKTIAFVDTIHATADFSQIIIDHASTVCNFNNISLVGLGVTNPGRLIVNSANPTVNITGGTWTNIARSILRSNTTVDALTARNSPITQNGATIENSTLVHPNHAWEPQSALLSDNPAVVQDNNFNSEGTIGHGLEIDTPGTYTFTGNSFSGFGSGSQTTGGFKPAEITLTDTYRLASGMSSPHTISAANIGAADSTRIVAVNLTFQTTQAVSSITIGGVTATITTAASASNRILIAWAAVPTGTTADIVINWSSTAGTQPMAAVYRIINASTTAFATSVVNSGESTTINTEVSGALIAGVMKDISSTGNQNRDWEGATEAHFDNLNNNTFTSGIDGDTVEQTSRAVDPNLTDFGLTGSTPCMVAVAFSPSVVPSNSHHNAAVYNKSGGTVTLNIAGGGSTPTVRTAGDATTVVNNNVAVTLSGLKDNTEVRILDNVTGEFIDGIENATAGTTNNRTFTFSLGAGVVVDIAIFNIDWILPPNNRIENYTIPTSDTTLPLTQIRDRNYVNP